MDKKIKMAGQLDCSTTSINKQSTMPFADSQMREWGYVAWRCLDDGTVLAVGPMLFGNSRLYVDVHAQGHADCYCYDDLEVAIAALKAFKPNFEEPTGWKRHPANWPPASTWRPIQGIRRTLTPTVRPSAVTLPKSEYKP